MLQDVGFSKYMKRFLCGGFALFWILSSAHAICAQTNAQIESELVASITELQKYSIYGDSYDEAKLTKAQDDFQQKLVKYSKIPSTLQYDFSELNKLIDRKSVV